MKGHFRKPSVQLRLQYARIICWYWRESVVRWQYLSGRILPYSTV